MSKINILLIEDDELSRLTLANKLRERGNVITAESAIEASLLLKEKEFSIAFIDLDLETELAGLDLIEDVKRKNTYAVVLSARENDLIVENAYERGCDDYLVKPFTKNSLDLIFNKFNLEKNKTSSLTALKEKMLTTDPDMVSKLTIISQSLLSERPILITGETGTGKTQLAKYITELSFGDEKRPFIHLNCSEISESLLESELFGHEKGAFTGAIKSKKGMLELADGGILFLDEIATMPIVLQKKLLKALEEKNFYPVGSEKLVRSNFRLISATCENLQEKIAKKEFRSDLYYRIEGFNIELKPLRNRAFDLPLLIKYFQQKSNRRFIFESDARMLFMNYKWPGNLRELAKVMDLLQLKADGRVTVSDLEKLFLPQTESQEINLEDVKKLGLTNYIQKIEMMIVKEALLQNKDKVRKTLTDLKLSNNAFYRIVENLKHSTASHV